MVVVVFVEDGVCGVLAGDLVTVGGHDLFEVWARNEVVFPDVGGEMLSGDFDVEAFVADTPETYRRALRKLCSSAELRLEMGGRAREMILEGFDWDRLGGRFFDVISPIGQST